MLGSVQRADPSDSQQRALRARRRLDAAAAPAIAAADYVSFTSSSTVRFFLASAKLGEHTRVVSIGPVTSETLREHGVNVDLEAARHDIDGLIEAIVADRTGGEA